MSFYPQMTLQIFVEINHETLFLLCKHRLTDGDDGKQKYESKAQ